jgi:D-beta-D-heptose 7-phosphate kinase/D-beta-D-heptose 1-phosphate adenosyltransferase
MLSKKVVFTNGVFDILHKGHIASLTEAASYGDILIVAVNADESVKKLKGPTRPINDEQARALLLASLLQTDAVIIFNEETPLDLIKQIMPDVLVKGGDYTLEQIAGAKEVLAAGGEVKIAGIVEGISTTNIIEKMKDL